ncbi:MAG TPA: alpha/beta fold hydrolase [Burkholderiales bacterium]
MPASEHILLEGPVGAIETVIDHPAGAPRGLALVAHPHPLYGGALDNKVAVTLAKTFVELGYVAVRPNFRGVGASAGTHDDGNGETDDLVAVVRAVRARENIGDAPLVLAGFSFGSLVQSRVARRLTAERIVFVGTAVTRGLLEAVPADSIVIHGERDETVPLNLVLRWAEPMELPVIVVPGADHFFHRRLHILRDIILRAWH